ncbi:type II secretion system F family protein [Nocardia sp. alder85J]|uniref:type II secretion system F family protein n=1 Tax=Nocardia sp. alder85J TaxID=2862949 RepID=UPI001CD5DD1F|nr:type II secretion system F family protein [Nocardia sp. alder85J]MCX4093627.1 type II secretion system F family protein [Nocardia sp. alder85J]
MTAAVSVGLLAITVLLLPGGGVAAGRLRLLLMRTLPVSGNPAVPDRADPLATAAVLDLLAACLRSGLPVAAAARAVAGAAGGPLASPLRRAADLLALGADPVAAWERAAADARSDELRTLARLIRRSARSGAALAEAVAEVAQGCRAAATDAATARAARAGTLVAGPLGLCFLPAFVCLGIVPVVIGLADRVLGGGLP